MVVEYYDIDALFQPGSTQTYLYNADGEQIGPIDWDYAVLINEENLTEGNLPTVLRLPNSSLLPTYQIPEIEVNSRS